MKNRFVGGQPAERNLCLRFSLVARIAGIPETQLRNWTTARIVHLDSDEGRDESNHRWFSRLDAVRIGLVARLTTLGFKTGLASEIIERLLALWIFTKKFEGKGKTIPRKDLIVRNTPESEILDLLRGSAITLWGMGSEAPPREIFDWAIQKGTSIMLLPGPQAGFNWIIHDKTQKTIDSVNEFGIALDTNLSIDIGRMMERQDERLKAAEEEQE